ncbi:integrase catalytic domain-containing protein [Trichonephila clavipes]|nr:integrase catalytic domain-containing protein [Trichonephila clavipes]
MADFPSDRVNVSRVFTKVGIDYAGPFFTKLYPGKFKKSYKCYVCIFICFAVKAIHLEIVTNCSTDDFLGALKRFFSRRGKPHDIFSDNGTNFVGANNELKKILQNLFIKEGKETIENFIASEGIVWHLNPPATPPISVVYGGSAASVHDAAVTVRKLVFQTVANEASSDENEGSLMLKVASDFPSKCVVTGWKLFQCKRGIVLKIAGAVVTYGIIVTQIGPG